MALIEGRLQTRKWQDQQGQDKYTTEIIASQVMFLESKKDADKQYQGGGSGQSPYPESRGQDREVPEHDDMPNF